MSYSAIVNLKGEELKMALPLRKETSRDRIEDRLSDNAEIENPEFKRTTEIDRQNTELDRLRDDEESPLPIWPRAANQSYPLKALNQFPRTETLIAMRFPPARLPLRETCPRPLLKTPHRSSLKTNSMVCGTSGEPSKPTSSMNLAAPSNRQMASWPLL